MIGNDAHMATSKKLDCMQDFKLSCNEKTDFKSLKIKGEFIRARQ